MKYDPFQLEQIVLGTLLRYPTEAPTAIIPALVHTRFIYGSNGVLGRQDHADLFQAITICVQVQKKASFPVNIKSQVSADLGLYIDALVDMLPGRFRIYEYDYYTLQGWASEIDRNGIIYNTAIKAKALGKIADSEDDFIKYAAANKDTDVDQWSNKVLADFSITAGTQQTAYKHISEYIPSTIDFWRRQRSGEQLLMVDCGLPAMMAHAMFPIGQLTMIHGMSGGGKSAVVHQTDLGSAIGLYVNGVQGCVIVNSLEMSYQTMITRAACLLSGFDSKRFITGPQDISDEDMGRLEEWAEFCSGLPLYIDDTPAVKALALEYRVRSLNVSNIGPVWRMSIDYLGLVHVEDSEGTEQQYAKVAVTGKNISRLGLNVTMISQSTFKDTRTYHAGLTGMRYSTGIQHSADVIAEVYNPQYLQDRGLTGTFPEPVPTNPYAIWIEKQKDRNFGILGWFSLAWEPEYTRITDIESNSTFGGQQAIFTHLKEAKKMMLRSRAEVPAVEDTYLGGFS